MHGLRQRWFFWFALSIATTPVAAVVAEPSESGRQPNIILIVADDLGYGELGCYGQQKIKTPAIDQMAREGMRFTQFYAGASLCASSRNVLLTGEHTGRCRIRDNGPPNIQTLRPEDVTIAEVLRDTGYATAVIGKWAIGGDLPETGGRPEDQGFDYFYGYLNTVHAHNHYPSYLWKNKEKVPLGNVVQDVPPGYAGFVGGMATKKVAYSQDLFVEESLEWIEQHQKSPFFLLLTPTIPHANPEARKLTGNGTEVPDLGTYAKFDWTEQNKGQAAMISRLDTGVGEILAKLNQLQLDKNTVVFFTSDNGPHSEAGHDPDFFNAAGGLRGRKFGLFEGGLRVPLIARWTGTIPANAVTDHVAYFGDFFATFCQLAGASIPDDGKERQSNSLLPTLLGDTAEQQKHAYLYWELHGGHPSQAIRFGDYKAIRNPLGSKNVQLYNLKKDVAERDDIAAQEPRRVEIAKQMMDDAHRESPLWPDTRSSK
ncbi:MAG: arylsulfatase [Pirellulales bacterium]|nr:arylsulfatase [Pirellulales bacterium]